MKISKFTSLHSYNGDIFLFNAEDERLLILVPELEKIYHKYADNPNGLQQVHPEFFNALKAWRFIIPQEENEAESLIHRWEEADNNPAHFGIIINPTLNCNMRCWYCYEPHEGKMVMTEKTRNTICHFIKNKTVDPQLKILNVSFFGGEPLLFFKESVLPILQYAAKACQEKDIMLYSNFTTNAVLLTDDIIEALNALPLGKKATFQITFDGNREVHNQTRVSTNKKPTYDTILHNMLSALQHGNEVSARFNYTYDNILTFRDVLEDFKSLGFKSFTSLLSIKFEHVWQDGKNLSKSQPLMQQIRNDFETEGFDVGSDEIHFRHTCYADSPRHVVINYNGNIFKCTARDFTSKSREGVLNNNGHIEWNEKFIKRMDIKYSNQACRNCFILPICNGSCTQNKIESKRKNVCFINMSEKDKLEYLKARVEELVQKNIKRQSQEIACKI
ncbi:MAG: SPASM domain-containing protein [Paraprevotella sp.]|nr:SPASM domain-containing protein [Paraprevotella sp.]